MTRSVRLALPARRFRVAAVIAASTVLLAALPVASAADASQRIDLRVLVVTDRTSNVEALRAQLASEGVPATVVDLGDGGRPQLTASFLADKVGATPRAKFQAVVLPNENGGSLTTGELANLAAFRTTFGIRQVNAYVWPSASVGLAAPTYSGPLDGKTALVTAPGKAGAYRYLAGSFPVDNDDSSVNESYGYLAKPATGARFTPLITIDGNALVGVHTDDAGREQMPITVAFNAQQTFFRLMAHGVVSWMTKGVHLGYTRSYLAVHADDLLLPDARWHTGGNCTPGDDCRNGEQTKDIRMTAADVAALVDWQKRRGLTIDMAYNASGSDEAIATGGKDPLTAAVLKHKASLRMLNHTYSHQFLGCLQDFTQIPWSCQTDAGGKIAYLPEAEISSEISKNLAWARARGIQVTATDLVTGEHSGLRTLPQQVEDNPGLAGALNSNGVTNLASDASREPAQRMIGSARTVMRHPMNVFYNVATEAEEVDEYNWIYTRKEDGGSGLCAAANSTCLSRPLGTSGYKDYIVPIETRIALSHVLSNDPRPHYIHQSNLAEQRIAYPLLDRILTTYRGWFATNAPLVNRPQGELGVVMHQADRWAAAGNTVEAYTLGGRLHVANKGSVPVPVPVTVPDGSAFGTAYAGEKSAFADLASNNSFSVAVPTS